MADNKYVFPVGASAAHGFHSIIGILTLVLLMTGGVFGQSQRKISGYLQANVNGTLYNVTKGNNPWGAGVGIQAIYNTDIVLKPTIEATADAYVAGNKVLYLYSDGTPVPSVDGMVNILAGGIFEFSNGTFISIVAGPSFIGSNVHVGLKPGLGFYFSRSRRVAGKISFINIFDLDKRTKQDFGSLNFSIAFKLF